ncbi:hypothetical protein DESPIG_03057 [Desulfovibrio piger ATCC 29098]|uniref:Uncharacterized protein n=1 Tax=Desulfovibrio piger ATCC 29098 TaxID=411464 RepID=B6WY08_9BACT|nr:hypothetical protein DESPIG_03057 [Desulfovibrio piger ATCC 29098]
MYAAQSDDVCTKCPSVLHTGPGPACQSGRHKKGGRSPFRPSVISLAWPFHRRPSIPRPCQCHVVPADTGHGIFPLPPHVRAEEEGR